MQVGTWNDELVAQSVHALKCGRAQACGHALKLGLEVYVCVRVCVDVCHCVCVRHTSAVRVRL